MERAIIKKSWFDAAIDSHIKLGINPTGAVVATHDPADEGGDSKGYACRKGILYTDIDEIIAKDGNEGCDEATSRAIAANADAFDHLMLFELPELAGVPISIDFGTGPVELELVNPFLLAWEDIVNGGDQDYDDMIYIFDQVLPGPEGVPEPATLLLLGSGLLGLAGYGRKKFLKKK